MDTTLTEETGQAILIELQNLNKIVSDELSRESIERDKKLDDDIEQAKELQVKEEALKVAESEKAKIESDRFEVLSNLLENSGVSNVGTLEGLEGVNGRLETIVNEIPNLQQNAVNYNFMGTSILVILLVGTAGFTLYKIGKFFGTMFWNFLN